MGWWEVILFRQAGETLQCQALGLGPFSSITSLEMKNLAVICSACSGAEKLLTPPIHRRSSPPCSLTALAIGAWGARGRWRSRPGQLHQQHRSVCQDVGLGKPKENGAVSKRSAGNLGTASSGAFAAQ